MELNINVADKKSLILIVDDIPKNLQVLSSILNTENYQISFASNGSQAIDVA
jgi:CheY-like chemotaxis protein